MKPLRSSSFFVATAAQSGCSTITDVVTSPVGRFHVIRKDEDHRSSIMTITLTHLEMLLGQALT